MLQHAPSMIGRARGMPGAGRPHGPPATKKAGGSHHRFSRDIPAFPARWPYGLLRVLPGAPGFLATVACATRERRRKRNTSVGVSGPRDLTVRINAVRRRGMNHAATPTRPPHPASYVRDDRDTPLTMEAGWGTSS